LAPYGNPEVYRDMFKTFYSLLPNGRHETHHQFFPVLNRLEGIPREKDDPFTQVHKDVAAAIQDALEAIAFHILKHYKAKYNPKRLCLAGGVAQNCTLNGKILYSGMFDDVFVQPASTDAGTAIGGALYTYYTEAKQKPVGQRRLEHVYWGTDIGDNDQILQTIRQWELFLDCEKHDQIEAVTAQLLAEGAVVGWVQGRTEFGPRALGNRSILADPRPPENKDVINAMVKKREAFRPFAPSVLEEYAAEYYDIPDHWHYKKFPFMTFVLGVRKDKQQILGATTHVDGTARIQTVSKDTNPRYWTLIDEFRKITGIPVVLNTSFNNNVEPIVNTVEEAIVCFLTTKINYLVAGNYLMKKKEVDHRLFLEMIPSLPLHVELAHKRSAVSLIEAKDIFEIRDNYLNTKNVMGGTHTSFPKLSFGLVRSEVSPRLYDALTRLNGSKTWGQLFDSSTFPNPPDDKEVENLAAEIKNLWTLRLVRLRRENEN